MKTILVANPKGGAGKSTLATNLAGYFARSGHRVMLGDIDRQQSSRDWLMLRSKLLAPIATWEIPDRDRPARPPEGTSHAVLDSPAGLHVSLGIAQVGQHRELVLREEALEPSRGARPRIDTHPDDGNEGVLLAHRLFLEQFFEKALRREDIE